MGNSYISDRWRKHPDRLAFQKKTDKRLSDIAEVKVELAADRLAKTKKSVSSVSEKPFNPAMTFWFADTRHRDRFKGVFPVLKNDKPIT